MSPTWDLDRTADGLIVRGEVDLGVADTFEKQASEAVLGPAGGNFLVDLSGVTFMDSAGLRALIRVLELGDGRRMIVHPSRQVFILLRLFGLTNGALPNVLVREPGSTVQPAP
jgi:anti-anti-sigma factor